MLPQTPEQWGAVLFWCGGIGMALMGLMVGASIVSERAKRAEEIRRRHDAAAYLAQIHHMTEAERHAWLAWVDAETKRMLAEGLTDEPVTLAGHPTADAIRERIADNEARRFDADRALREWTK